MFGIGIQELIIILLIAFVIVGPERMPDLARRAGLFIRDMRRMYDNLRGELGPDYDEVERAIRTLRSLDPRRELDSYGRKFLDDLAKEAGPEAEAALHKSPSELADTLKQSLSINPATGTQPATASIYDAEPISVQEFGPVESPVEPEPPVLQPRRARTYPVATGDTQVNGAADASPISEDHPLPNAAIARLGHDLLNDSLLDRPLKEALGEASNGHEHR